MDTQKPSSLVENGWRIQLFSKHGWVDVANQPIHKTKAKNAARVWKNEHKIRARIAKVRVTTETFTLEEV